MHSSPNKSYARIKKNHILQYTHFVVLFLRGLILSVIKEKKCQCQLKQIIIRMTKHFHINIQLRHGGVTIETLNR
jgi:hypothetical protein